MQETKDPRLEAEFDMLMARAGITLPADRRAGVFEEFVGIQAHIQRIWECKLPPDVEPAATVSFAPAAKGKS